MIFGKHTLAETRDLLAVTDSRFKQTGEAYNGLHTKPEDLKRDWEALSAKWAIDRKDIASELLKKALLAPMSPSSLVATEPEYQRILAYVQFGGWTKGSLEDIADRIWKLRGERVNYIDPNRDAGLDVDHELMGPLNSATIKMDAAAEAAKQGAKEAATSNTGLIVGGSILATLAGIAAIKYYL